MTMSRGQNAQEHVGCHRLRVGSKKSARLREASAKPGPARPQAAKEDEAYGESTSSLPSNENAAGGFFQQTPNEKCEVRDCWVTRRSPNLLNQNLKRET